MSVETFDSAVKSASFISASQVEGHTVYTIKASNGVGEAWTIRKRYSEVREFRDKLRTGEKKSSAELPAFPRKRLWGNQSASVVARRQERMSEYIEGVLRHDRLSLNPAVRDFFGSPVQTTERIEAGLHQDILSTMKNNLLILALPPAPLDDAEMALRLKKYGQAMRLHALSQPVDPINLRSPGFTGDPVPLCATNADQFERLCSQPARGGGADCRVLDSLLNQLCAVARPKKPLVDPKTIVVDFPRVM
eukprot:TRINITY_DN28995_c0_g1_i1.p1 TRINITY_DN28995_c0_g1~~TRINITY_DN28995_c0_g1_i1.p1  ORF type:complete len:249 (+),score=35.51 TRINITY_DN28995_c0_g1_i1:59-805(+)